MRDEHTTQIDAVIGHALGVGDPGAVAQSLETPWLQGIEFGQGILLVQQQLKLIGPLWRQAQAQPRNDERNQGGREQRHAKQPLLAHAGGREHGHFAFEVHPPVGQQDPEKQPQRQDQLEEPRHAKAHDQEQRARIQQARGGLGEVFDEATAHDDDQQHGTDGAQGQQDFAG
ncbi:hypothetical protein D9M71_282870 [compost metagenome]